ncbi:MAG: aminopeptidase P family protein [Gemmatimonadetes bacterium]|nr:aminopeptidase P family protein [Gemmatimonadota bacterium]
MGMFKGSREFTRVRADISAMQAAIRDAGLDGWLLYDLHARNDVAAQLIGLGDLSRRFFVLIPAEGDPTAIIHGIEQAPWEKWPWRRRMYVGWQELGAALRETLDGQRRIAMEYSPDAAVPAIDLVSAGIVELVRSTGVEVVSSGDLVTRFYSCWTPEQLRSHYTASAALAQIAEATFARLAHAVAAGENVNEVLMREWVLADMEAHGVAAGPDAIAATGLSAADPHYSPQDGGAVFKHGDIVLLDLWSKQSEEMVYADQTWMAYLGPKVPERPAKLFAVIRDARDAAVAFLHEAWKSGRPIEGREVDDVTRNVVTGAGYGAYFIHRTGHSIDRSTHGMGPNIDNLETNDTRRLMPGVGFSIEPGIYIPGEIGMRTEINVHIGDDGPEVTTPDPQHDMQALLAR